MVNCRPLFAGTPAAAICTTPAVPPKIAVLVGLKAAGAPVPAALEFQFGVAASHVPLAPPMPGALPFTSQ